LPKLRSNRGQTSRVAREQLVYRKTRFDSGSGEMEVWDHEIFSSIVRAPQYHFLSSFVGKISPEVVLDIGCGAGWATHFLSSSVPRTVGVDVSRELLSGARSLKKRSEDYILADGSRLPIRTGSIETITCVSALHHLPPVKALKEWRRVLRPCGRVVLIEPNALNPIAILGRACCPLETHTEDERPFVPSNLRELFTTGGWRFIHWDTQVLFAFAVSRFLRVLRLPAEIGRSLIPLVRRLEEIAQSSSRLRRLGWVIMCVVEKVD
jgi:SAM-dependent methyltransferase